MFEVYGKADACFCSFIFYGKFHHRLPRNDDCKCGCWNKGIYNYRTALDRVSGATDKDLYEWKLDYDDGRPEYEGKIIYGGTEYEFTIDAATGSVMEWDAEKVR